MTIPQFANALQDRSGEDTLLKALATLSESGKPIRADDKLSWPIWA